MKYNKLSTYLLIITILTACNYDGEIQGKELPFKNHKLMFNGKKLKDISGIIYDSTNDLYYTISNSINSIYVLRSDFSVKKKLNLPMKGDWEDLTLIKTKNGISQIAILDENGFMQIIDINLASKKKAIHVVKTIKLKTRNFLSRLWNLNKNEEGITYVEDNSFLIGIEKPPAIYQLDTSNKNFVYLRMIADLKKHMSDLSSLMYYKDHILVLSDEARKLFIFTKQFKLKKTQELHFKNCEGITVKNNSIIIVCEPNVIFELHDLANYLNETKN